MAKKRQKVTRFSIDGFDARHYRTTEQYVRAVEELFNRATADVAAAAAKGNVNSEKPFAFSDYPQLQAAMRDITNQLASRMTTVIETGSRRQWLFACDKNDQFIASIMDTSKLKKSELEKMQDRNLDALSEFQKRKVDGMNLSQRVWKYVGQYKEQMETALDVGLGEGRSAQQLATNVRENLNNPDLLFRRVRDKRGNLVLSKAAKAFHPGRGVYRSSVKNAQRLTRSEINMAYRESDYQRWRFLDFVIGYEIRRSNHEPLFKCDVCEKLKGRYPKGFKFVGWHPQCMCYMVPILTDYYSKEASDDRVNEMRAALIGTEYKKYVPKETVTDVPQGFKDWVKENKEKQKNWSATPYFIRDNFKNGKLSDGLKIDTNKPVPVVVPDRPKIDPIQQQLDALQPQIEQIRKLCNDWGLNTFPLDSAIKNRNLQEVSDALKLLQGRVNAAIQELEAYAADAAAAIFAANQNNVDASEVVADLRTVRADKREWVMGKAGIKRRLEELKARIAAATKFAHPALLKKYVTNEDVDKTFKKINSDFEHGEKWFENGDLIISETNQFGLNGFTTMDGRISLRKERLEMVKSALGKIGSGKSEEITFREADAMATFWHEITHNRNIPGNNYMSMNRTPIQTDVMEMMNEFVARKTLPEFYSKLGCPKTPYEEFIYNRDSTGYNRRVLGYDFVISKLGLDAKKVLESARKNLFALKYSEQETTAIQALLDGGLDKFKGVDGKPIGKAKVKKLVAFCRKGASATTIEHYMQDNGIIPK